MSNNLITLPGKILSNSVYGTEHLPILIKEYDLYQVNEFQNNHDGDLFFINVIPTSDNIFDTWSIEYKLYVTTPDNDLLQGYYECNISTTGSNLTSKIFNGFGSSNSQEFPIESHLIMRYTDSEKYQDRNNYPIKIGISVGDNLERLYKIEIYSTYRCSAVISDDIETYEDVWDSSAYDSVDVINAKTNSINYLDLDNTPTIPTVPTNVSAFTNDSGYLTQHQDISGKADKSEMSVVPGTGNDSDKTTITLKSGTSATVLTTHQNISGKVPYREIISTLNGFDERKLWQYEIHNTLWAAEKRYDVTTTGFSSGNISAFFDGSFESRLTISAGNTGVITIAGKNGTKMFGGGYPYGYLEIGFYNTDIPESVTCRVYSDWATNPGWHSITLTNVSKVNNGALYRGSNTSFYGVTQMEITVTAKSNKDSNITEIAFYQTRGTLQQMAMFNKTVPQTLYHDLTGTKFIVSNGTSSQFLKADGSLDSNTYLTSFTETDPTVPSWAKESSKPSYNLDEVVDGTTRKIPTNVSDLNNDSGFITGINSSNVTTALGFTPMDSALKGANSGVAELDATGKIPSSQLPSYVDDVIEGYYKSADGKIYEESTYITEISGETGKIYVDLATNKTYRWSGSAFVEISESLALGTTSSTAFRGDYGNIAYQHSQAAHAPSDAEKNTIQTIKVNSSSLTPDSNRVVDITVPTKVSDLTNDSGFTTNTGTITSIKMNGSTISSSGEADLGTVITSHQDISGKENTSNKVTSISSSSTGEEYPSAYAVYHALQSYTPTSQLATVATSGDYDDLTNKPTIPTVPVQDVTVGGTSVVSNGTAVIPQEVFWATYGTTTAAEVAAAEAAGKIVMCARNDYIYILHVSNSGAYYFTASIASGITYLYLNKTSNAWSSGGLTAEKISDKVSTISGNETNTTKYPNTKAVADALADYVQKSQTAGLLKNDGTVDTNTYLTQHQDISGKQDVIDSTHKLDYSLIDNTPTIPNETTVTNWGFTKNTGTVTGVKVNGITNNPTSGIVDIGTVITTETSLSKGTTSGNGNAVTDITLNGHQITLTKGKTFLESYTETDPVFSSSPAANITTNDITNWNTPELPSVSSSDNGKILMVQNGVWSLVTPVSIYSGSGTPSNSLGNDGDIYIQQ